MVWTHTSPITTQVIQCHSLRDGANHQFVNPPMRHMSLALMSITPITISVLACRPFPAIVAHGELIAQPGQ
jgi:hypothetical protein